MSLSYFSFQPVLHDLCNKGHGMCYSVRGMVHIKDPLLLSVGYVVAAAGFHSLTIWVVLCDMSDAILQLIKCVECIVK